MQEPEDPAHFSSMAVPDWTWLFLLSRRQKWIQTLQLKLLKQLKERILHLGLKFLCLMFSEPSAPLRIPLRGPPMILFSAVCICWFDNPVILPSEGDSGSTNTQQRGELLDCDGAHCSSQTMSSLWCLWCMAGRGKFLQSVLKPPNPSVYPPCPSPPTFN